MADSLLGCRKLTSPSLDERLLSCPDQAEDDSIRECLLRLEGNTPTMKGSTLRLSFRDMLSLPSAYETPWKLACEFVKHLQASSSACRRASTNQLFPRSIIADIQNFLHQTASFWWEEERKKISTDNNHKSFRVIRPVQGDKLSTTTPRSWILALLAIILEPLWLTKSVLSDSDRDSSSSTSADAATTRILCNNENWTAPLELVSTIVSLSQDLEVTMLNSCLNMVFPIQQKKYQNQEEPDSLMIVRPDRLLPWVNLASELRPVLREDDWNCVLHIIKEAFTKTTTQDKDNGGKQNKYYVPQQDFPGLADAIFSLCVAVMSKKNARKEDVLPWQELILRLLSSASIDLATLSTVETILQSSLSSVPSTFLQYWTKSLVTAATPTPVSWSDIPTWTQSNLFLLVLRASRQSGSQLISYMVSQAFGNGGGRLNDIDLNGLCWSRIVDFAFPPDDTTGQNAPLLKTTTACSLGNDLQQMFEGVSYTIGGCFKTKQGRRIDSVSDAGFMVSNSLFLGLGGSSVTSIQQLQAMERAQAWVHAAVDYLERSSSINRHFDWIFAVVVLVTVFLELPQSRSSLVRGMLVTFSFEGRTGKVTGGMSKFYIVVISILLASSQPNTQPSTSELDRLSTVFSKQMPLSLFLDLSKTLSPLYSARQNLLSAAEKQLHKPLEGNWWVGSANSRGLREHSDRVKCGLYSLVILVASNVWGDFERKAWFLLSDIIVACRPALPVAIRSWLFRRLSEQLKDGGMDRLPAAHVHRACLCRLLYFFGTARLGSDSFLPEKAFTVWGDSGRASRPGHIQPAEDLVGLFQLVLELVSYSTDRSNHINKPVDLWRKHLATLLPKQSEETRPSSGLMQAPSPPEMPFLPFDQHEDLELHASMYCVALVLRYILGQEQKLVRAGVPSLDVVKSMIVTQEVSSFSESVTSLPKWLQPQTHIIGIAPSRMALLPNRAGTDTLCFNLCDTLASFLLNRGSTERITGSETRNLCLSVSAIYEAKRKLSTAMAGNNQHGHFMRNNTLCSVFTMFCNVATAAIQKCIVGNDEFSVFDEVLAAVLDLCDDVYTVLEVSISPALLLVAHATQALFTSLCDEMASRQLIAYFEQKVPSGGSIGAARIGPVGSPDEIDATIRGVRARVLRLLLRCIPALRWKPLLVDFTEESCSEVNEKSSQVLLSLVEVLVSDLSAGVHGRSGGLSYNLFGLYLDCIELCADGLAEHLKESTDLAASVCRIGRHARDCIDEILSSYALIGSFVLRKSLALELYILPSLVRLAIRQTLRVCDHPDVYQYWKVEDVSACRSLDQCSAILKRRAKEGLSNNATWELTSGAEHDTSNNGAIQFGDDSDPETCNGNEPVVFVASLSSEPSARGFSQEHSTPVESWLQISSERAWKWTFCSTLQTIEWEWEESLQAIQDKGGTFSSTEGLAFYMKNRKTELVKLMASISELLNIIAKQDNQNGSSEDVLRMSLTILPVPTKIRLQALLNRVFMVLQKAVKTVKAFNQQQCDEHSTRRISFAESLCCLYSWLDSGKDSTELTISVRNWHAAEKEVASSETGVPYIADSAFFRKFPQTVIRAEELECSLRSFLDDLSNNCGQEERNPIARIDHLLGLKDGTENKGLLSLVAKKVKLIEGARKSDVESTRKRALEADSRVRKERRKRHIRSRNQVVDKWLRSDQQFIGRDEAMEDDAYADLEDFLVEG